MTQLKKQFIANDAVDGTKIHLDNNQSIRSRNAANNADIDVVKVTVGNVAEFGIVPAVANGVTPSMPNHLATVGTVDTAIGLAINSAYTKRIDIVSDTVIYRGEALPGAADTAPVWRISKITITGNTYSIQWADGDGLLNNIWNNHLTLNYI